MLMIRKYFLLKVISVATSIICQRTWSQVTYETCTIQDSYVTSVVQHCRACLFSLSKVSPSCPLRPHWQSSDGAALFRLYTKKRYHALKTAPLSKNSISKMCNYLTFECWKPALIIINYKFWIRIFLGSRNFPGCKVKSTFNLYFIL